MCPPPRQSADSSPERCEEFLNHFRNKIAVIWQNFISEIRVLVADVVSCPFSTFTHFEEIFLSTLEQSVIRWRLITCLLGRFLKEVLQMVGENYRLPFLSKIYNFRESSFHTPNFFHKPEPYIQNF